MAVKLGDLLVKAKLVTPEQVEAALQSQRDEGGKFGEALIRATRLQKEPYLGNPAYSPPELIRGGGNPRDPRVDVYGLGGGQRERCRHRHQAAAVMHRCLQSWLLSEREEAGQR